MKITVNDPNASNVEAVFLNGKRLITCIEADDEAGYAIVLVPPPDPAKDDPSFNDKSKMTIIIEDATDAAEWTTKRLEGEVEILLRKKEGLDDSGLDT